MLRASFVFFILSLSSALLLAGCSSTTEQASLEIVVNTVLSEEHFDNMDTTAWPSYSLGGVVFGVVDGQYAAIASGSGYIWELNRRTHQDVAIDVSIEQLSPAPENIYGVICRAHPSLNGMGYYFLLDGQGQFGIRKGDGERITVLVPWTKNDAIKQGTSNQIRAVCVQDYLALYINDTFMAEVRDSHFSEGWAGFAINAGADLQIAVTFDDLIIHEAELINNQ